VGGRTCLEQRSRFSSEWKISSKLKMSEGKNVDQFESLRAGFAAIADSLKGVSIVNRKKEGGYFVCQVTKETTDNRYYLEEPGFGRKKPKKIGCFITLPVAAAHIRAVLHDDAATAESIVQLVAAQYKQDHIPRLPCTLMELAANPSLAVSGDMATWLEVPGAETGEENKAARPKRKAKGEAPAAEEGEVEAAAPPKAKKAKKVIPKVEVPKFASGVLRASKNAAKALALTKREKKGDEQEPEEHPISVEDVNKKRAALSKHERFERVVLQGALLEYVRYAEGEKGKRNPWFPEAAGDVLVSCGSRKVVFKLAEKPADEEEAKDQ